MEVELIDSRSLPGEALTASFSRPSALRFDAGDYIELSLSAGRRWFTIASAPEDDQLEFITKLGEAPSQFKSQLANMKPGDKAKISPAIGNFNLPVSNDRPLVWMAGGIGITPYLSMLRHASNTERQLPMITLVYAAKPDQHLALEEIESAEVKLVKLDRRPKLSDLISYVAIDKSITYLSGPQPLCEQLFDQLLSHGVPRRNLKLDYFEGYERI